MDTKEVTAIIRNYIKSHHKNCKFSIRFFENVIYVNLMTADFEAFIETGMGFYFVNINHIEVNRIMTEECKALMIDIRDFVKSLEIKSYLFVLNLEIGKRETPFTKK